MPFKSLSQRRLFYAKENRGEIPKSTVQEWENATPRNKKLPEHVKKAVLRIKHAVHNDLIPGGKADGKSPSDFDPKEMAKGQKVEMEHTNNPAIATEIAMDHEAEFPNKKYYEALDAMEKRLKAAAYQIKTAEPPPPKGVSMKEWDKILSKGPGVKVLPKTKKTAYYSQGIKEAFYQLGI